MLSIILFYVYHVGMLKETQECVYKNNLYKTVYKTSNDRKMLLVFIGGKCIGCAY